MKTGEGVNRNVINKTRKFIYVFSFGRIDFLENLKEYLGSFFEGVKVKPLKLDLKIQLGKIIDTEQ